MASCEVERSWANPWGLYGVGGNVWEPCTVDASPPSFLAWRGGAWDQSEKKILMCDYRQFEVPHNRSTLGFRLVLSPFDLERGF